MLDPNDGHGGDGLPETGRTRGAFGARPFSLVKDLGWRYVVVAAIVILVGLIGVSVSLAWVASPSTVEAGRADAVMVHAGRGDRLDAGLQLVRSGVAPVLVVSATGSEYGRGEDFVERLCEREQPFEVLCPMPEPVSTIGEARAFGRLADERGWEILAVVTSRGHLARAQLAVSQCTEAETLPVAADPDLAPSMETVVEEWMATGATATLWRACW